MIPVQRLQDRNDAAIIDGMGLTAGTAGGSPAGRDARLWSDARGQFSWALYDWANSPFTTLIITFIFPAYFARAIVGDDVAGQAMWGYAIGVSGLLLAVLSPLLGAVADAGGRQKP